MNRFRWWWTLIPLILVLAAALVLSLADFQNPIFYAQADLVVLLFMLGIALAILVAVVFVILDQVEKRRVVAAIRFADDRRRFLRRLDHELKNPLTAILAGLANLSTAEDAGGSADTLHSIQNQVNRMRRVVSELRKLSELETRPLDLEPIHMTELLEDVYSLAESQAESNKRVLSLSIPRAPWPLPTISGDRDLLVLAIHNLLDNAIKFTRAGDTVEMRAFEDGSRVVIEIADTGPGIPEDEVDHVWEELYRGKGARGIQGSGLGLALVKAIVLRHDGTITLRSRQGEGTVFTVRLPVG